jgi:hypothetical protein
MKNATKMLGSLAIAGVIAAGSSAFTAGGLTLLAGQEATSLGGTVTQNVTGAIALNNIAYGYADPNQLDVNLITLTFGTTAAGRTITVDLNNAGDAGFVCAVGATPFTTVTCTPTVAFTGLNQLDVTVV